jgi:hypothetical protein
MEFLRILKPGGWLAVFKVPCTDEKLVEELKAIRTKENGWETACEETRRQLLPPGFYFGHEEFRTWAFPGFVRETWEQFLGRVCSFAPAPQSDHPSRHRFEVTLREIFDRRAVGKTHEVPVATEVTFGHMRRTRAEAGV